MCQSKAQGGRRCALHLPSTRAMLAAVRHNKGLDLEQGDAVFRKALARAKPATNPPTPQKWNTFIDEQIQRLALDLNVEPDDFDRLSRKLHETRDEVPDARTFAALKDLEARAQKAQSAIRRQLHSAAAFRTASPEEAAERFAAYRHQYKTELRHLPRDERPAPPADWVQGYTTKDMMAVSTPTDPATLYAMYRCQADPEAFATRGQRGFASIDLETAGPQGKDGFVPANGSIIEVGIVLYDADGVETSRYEQLIAPDPEVASNCGTGAVDVHGITMDDVANAPSWSTVAPQVAAELDGRVLMAQNAMFESDWLNHHMQATGQDFDRWGPVVDTMRIAQQHNPNLPSHRLASICASVGVEYTNGHRALHDADVAGRAFFAIRQQITSTYLSDPARARTPQPASGSGRSRGAAPRAERLRAGDFNPAEVIDPWTSPRHTPTEVTAAA